MSDLLTVLAKRVLEPARIRPRTPSRFEGDGGVWTSLERREDAAVYPPTEPETPNVALRPSLSPNSQQDVAIDRVPAPAPRSETAIPEFHLIPPTRVDPAQQKRENRIELPTSVPASTQVMEPAATSPPAPELRPMETVERLETRHTELIHREERVDHYDLTQEFIERRVERLVAEAATPVAQQPGSLPQMMSQPQPYQPWTKEIPARVEINIGRIEILPAATATEPRHAEAPRPAPATSLEDYLSERTGKRGRRS